MQIVTCWLIKTLDVSIFRKPCIHLTDGFPCFYIIQRLALQIDQWGKECMFFFFFIRTFFNQHDILKHNTYEVVIDWLFVRGLIDPFLMFHSTPLKHWKSYENQHNLRFDPSRQALKVIIITLVNISSFEDFVFYAIAEELTFHSHLELDPQLDKRTTKSIAVISFSSPCDECLHDVSVSLRTDPEGKLSQFLSPAGIGRIEWCPEDSNNKQNLAFQSMLYIGIYILFLFFIVLKTF